MVMRLDICADLLDKQRVAPQVRLPSIRTLAGFYGVAPLTMHRILQSLAEQGHIYAIAHKGFFWGNRPAKFPSWPANIGLQRRDEIGNSLRSSLERGDLDPFAELPSLKTLAHQYGSTPRTISLVLQDLAQKHLLQRKGRHWSFRIPPENRHRNSVVLVQRCDAKGCLLIDTDREMDFIKAVYREVAAHDLQLQIIGWNGSEMRWVSKETLVLGILVSTWLIPDVQKLMSQLRKKGLPIAVWWEHPKQTVPISRKDRVAYFNLSFGRVPGELVAEHLLRKKCSRIIFLSPFHQSEWSRNRYEGMRDILLANQIPMELFADNKHSSSWEFQEEAWKESRKITPQIHFDSPKVIRRRDEKIRSILMKWIKLIEAIEPRTAWVCVNDQVAEMVMDWLLSKSLQIQPYLVSFDNSKQSFRLQFDSFAFNTESMVRNMLHHLLQPGAERLQELQGSVVCKSRS